MPDKGINKGRADELMSRFTRAHKQGEKTGNTLPGGGWGIVLEVLAH